MRYFTLLMLLSAIGCGASAPPARQQTTLYGMLNDGTKVQVVIILEGKPQPGPVDPPQPQPTDAFTDTLHFVYGSEKNDVAREALIAVYRDGIEVVGDQRRFATIGDLYAHLRARSNTTVSHDAIPKTRVVIAAELDKKLPVSPGIELTSELRKEAALQFQRVIHALETCK